MTKAYLWITENWQLVGATLILMTLLGMSGTITQSVRQAKNGLKEVFTPLGLIIFLGIIYMVYRIWLNIQATI